ncbi:hypothetical protein BIW11_12306, partial [Tropilaelaps mercedesae]
LRVCRRLQSETAALLVCSCGRPPIETATVQTTITNSSDRHSEERWNERAMLQMRLNVGNGDCTKCGSNDRRSYQLIRCLPW